MVKTFINLLIYNKSIKKLSKGSFLFFLVYNHEPSQILLNLLIISTISRFLFYLCIYSSKAIKVFIRALGFIKYHKII
jgi:hypothetical protein